MIKRWKFLKAYAADLDGQWGSEKQRAELPARFDASRFFWQRERTMPNE